MNQELSDVQAGFRQGRGATGQIANIRWIIEKERELKKKRMFKLLFTCTHFTCQQDYAQNPSS